MPFFCHLLLFLEFVPRTKSVQQGNHWIGDKRFFFNPFCGQDNDSVVALTQQTWKRLLFYTSKD